MHRTRDPKSLGYGDMLLHADFFFSCCYIDCWFQVSGRGRQTVPRGPHLSITRGPSYTLLSTSCVTLTCPHIFLQLAEAQLPTPPVSSGQCMQLGILPPHGPPLCNHCTPPICPSPVTLGFGELGCRLVAKEACGWGVRRPGPHQKSLFILRRQQKAAFF